MAEADVYGSIHGDPQLVLDRLAPAPGQSGIGFIVPEPASLALLGCGLAALALLRRRGPNGRARPAG